LAGAVSRTTSSAIQRLREPRKILER
jgi:hypothetical protein